MKTTRWLTPAGCFVLLISAIFHSSGYVRLLGRMHAVGIAPPFDVLLKACWWSLSAEFVSLGIIALLAHRMEHGGRKQGARIVLLCAATSGATAGILWGFLGLFAGVYLLAAATMLLLIGGWLQRRAESAQ